MQRSAPLAPTTVAGGRAPTAWWRKQSNPSTAGFTRWPTTVPAVPGRGGRAGARVDRLVAREDPPRLVRAPGQRSVPLAVDDRGRGRAPTAWWRERSQPEHPRPLRPATATPLVPRTKRSSGAEGRPLDGAEGAIPTCPGPGGSGQCLPPSTTAAGGPSGRRVDRLVAEGGATPTCPGPEGRSVPPAVHDTAAGGRADEVGSAPGGSHRLRTRQAAGWTRRVIVGGGGGFVIPYPASGDAPARGVMSPCQRGRAVVILVSADPGRRPSARSRTVGERLRTWDERRMNRTWPGGTGPVSVVAALGSPAQGSEQRGFLAP